MRENIRQILKDFNAMTEGEKRHILAVQAEERIRKINQPVDLAALTNAQIAAMDEFREFCAGIGKDPTSRAASKYKNDFIAWKNRRQQTGARD